MIDDDQPDPVEGERAPTGVEPPHTASKKAPAKQKAAKKPDAKATRTVRPFPAAPFEESLEIARTIHEMGSRKVRRLTLFERLDKSPTSGHSRRLVVNPSKYGLTTGSSSAEFLELTDTGEIAVSRDVPERKRRRAWFDLAILGIEPFKVIYDEFAGKRFPSPEVLRDFLREKGSRKTRCNIGMVGPDLITLTRVQEPPSYKLGLIQDGAARTVLDFPGRKDAPDILAMSNREVAYVTGGASGLVGIRIAAIS